MIGWIVCGGLGWFARGIKCKLDCKSEVDKAYKKGKQDGIKEVHQKMYEQQLDEYLPKDLKSMPYDFKREKVKEILENISKNAYD